MVLNAVALIATVASVICWIIVLIKIFQDGDVVLGVVGICCPLAAFIVGWMRADKYAIKNVMIIWTVIVVVNLALSFQMRAMFPVVVPEAQ